MQCAGRALQESGIQLHSQRRELHQAIQSTDQSQREKIFLCTELEMRDRALQEDHTRSYQEIDELKKMCCTEAESAKPLRSDGLSTQKETSESSVNQLMVQIQELHDTVNSLNDAREYHDPETASSSGLSHVPSEPLRIRSPRGLISRDSCLQLDTSF